MPPLGWMEWVVIAQTAMPALMYVPGLSVLRAASRAVACVVPLVAWGAVLASGRRVAGKRPPATGWLTFCSVWLMLSIAHPTTNSFLSGLAEAALYISVFCPAFWAPAAIRDARQLRRLLVIFLICNGASSLMGIAQVYRPETFRPPNIPSLAGNADRERDMTITTDDGRQYLRPCGLSDQPGYAGICGIYACLSGLAIALWPGGAWWKRSAAASLAVVGLAVIFYSQVRFSILVLIAGLIAWAFLLVLRRETRALLRLGMAVGLLALVAVGWVIRSGGAGVLNRFYTLVENRADVVFYQNRGHFVEAALTVELVEFPLGAGIGRTGMMYVYFGNPMAPPDSANLYAETQIEFWILDGGVPLLVGSVGALATAMWSAMRIALRGKDRELSYWAVIVVVFGVFTVLGCLGGVPFVSLIGMQFWVLIGAAVRGGRPVARGGAAEAIAARGGGGMTRLAAPSPPPSTSRASRATFTYASMLLFTVVTTFTGLLITPWLIWWLGEERYGASRVLFEYAGYLALLDLGLGGALSPLLSRALARRDAGALQGVMAAGIRLYAIITAAVLVVGFAFLPWLPFMVRVQPALHGDLRWAWAFTVLGYLPLVLAPFRALGDSEQRGYVSNGLLSVQALGLALLSLLFASLGLGIKGQSLAVSLIVGLVALTLAALTLRRHPDCLRGLRRPPDPEASAALRKLRGPALTINLAGRIGLLSDSIVVGLILSPALVTILFVTQRLVTIVQGQLLGIGNASWAALAELHGRGEHEVFNRRLVELSRVVAILAVTVLGPILAFNSQFIALWLGAGRDGGELIVVAAATNARLVALVRPLDLGLHGDRAGPPLPPPGADLGRPERGGERALTWSLRHHRADPGDDRRLPRGLRVVPAPAAPPPLRHLDPRAGLGRGRAAARRRPHLGRPLVAGPGPRRAGVDRAGGRDGPLGPRVPGLQRGRAPGPHRSRDLAGAAGWPPLVGQGDRARSRPRPPPAAGGPPADERRTDPPGLPSATPWKSDGPAWTWSPR